MFALIMRAIPFLVSTFITIVLVFVLDKKWGAVPALGKFLSPQQGFWQNAEPADFDFTCDLEYPQLKGKVTVYFDERLVPHIFADHDEDAYFTQGYLHAKFRLWQMEFQTMAAAGRISELLGNDPRFIRYDREQRRKGMVFGAENALKEMEANPVSKSGCDAYTEGVNAFINSLTESTLPVEYKLLGYKPEPWSNLKIALFLKQMSNTLAGYETDLENTNTKSVFTFDQFMKLDPQVPDSLEPIIPKGTIFSTPGIVPVPPATTDSLYFGKRDTVPASQITRPSPNNGSNNWAINGTKSLSGAPILCNDPHLELTFPSIWYEMQISTPEFNSYGATFPGSPNVIIGFNDSIAFGFTNAQRDVKDYYEIKFKDDSKQEYWFNGKWEKTRLRVEQIKVKGGRTVQDTVAYTIFGPVMFDKSFSNQISNDKAIAVKWSAHEPSNEGLMWFYLNRAKGYEDYYSAIKNFSCPGQNMIFASKRGDIALWQQARFPARWYGQGIYVMPGHDSSYMWQGYIPQAENPNVINPASGFIQSANQRPVDSAYPYFIPGNYIIPRGISIARRLSAMSQITPKDMMTLQNDYYSVLAEGIKPLFLKYVKENDLSADAKRYLEIFKEWNLQAAPNDKGPTIYQVWLDSLESLVWKDEFDKVPSKAPWPDEQTLLEALNKDSAFLFVDNINTPEKENLYDIITQALQKAAVDLIKEEQSGKLEWTKHKEPTIYHLLRTALLPFSRKIPVGGWSNTINATTHSHGPSWRMIVHLTYPTEAYGVYPGGQSGNAGSKFYDSFVDTWSQGKYYPLWMMKRDEGLDKRVRWKMVINKNRN